MFLPVLCLTVLLILSSCTVDACIFSIFLYHLFNNFILIAMYYICSLKPNRVGVQPMEDPIVCETTLDVESVVSSYSRNYIVLVTRAIGLPETQSPLDYGNKEE